MAISANGGGTGWTHPPSPGPAPGAVARPPPPEPSAPAAGRAGAGPRRAAGGGSACRKPKPAHNRRATTRVPKWCACAYADDAQLKPWCRHRAFLRPDSNAPAKSGGIGERAHRRGVLAFRWSSTLSLIPTWSAKAAAAPAIRVIDIATRRAVRKPRLQALNGATVDALRGGAERLASASSRRLSAARNMFTQRCKV